MPHDVDLIILLAVGFGIALIFGYIAARLPSSIDWLSHRGHYHQSQYTWYRGRYGARQSAC